MMIKHQTHKKKGEINMGETLQRKTNLEALKNAMNNSKRGGFKYWKPQDNGKYNIRFLPHGDVFFKGAFQHKIGDNYYFCPRTEGEACPICEKYHKLYKLNTPAAIELAKSIKPKEQYLYNIVVRQELDKPNPDQTKVFVYMAGKKLHGLLMNYMFDEEYGDLTDCDNGYDFILFKEDDPSGSGFPSYMNSKPRKNPSKLFEDDETIDKVLRECKDLDKEVELLEYDELKNILTKFLSNEYDGGEQFLDGAKPVAKKVETLVEEEEVAPVQKKAVPADVADDFEKSLLASLNEDE